MFRDWEPLNPQEDFILYVHTFVTAAQLSPEHVHQLVPHSTIVQKKHISKFKMKVVFPVFHFTKSGLIGL